MPPIARVTVHRQYTAVNLFRKLLKLGWLRGVDLNHRPLGYEPNELPDCSTPQKNHNSGVPHRQTTRASCRGDENCSHTLLANRIARFPEKSILKTNSPIRRPPLRFAQTSRRVKRYNQNLA